MREYNKDPSVASGAEYTWDENRLSSDLGIFDEIDPAKVSSEAEVTRLLREVSEELAKRRGFLSMGYVSADAQRVGKLEQLEKALIQRWSELQPGHPSNWRQRFGGEKASTNPTITPDSLTGH